VATDFGKWFGPTAGGESNGEGGGISGLSSLPGGVLKGEAFLSSARAGDGASFVPFRVPGFRFGLAGILGLSCLFTGGGIAGFEDCRLGFDAIWDRKSGIGDVGRLGTKFGVPTNDCAGL
jgi:hypothetical protein